MSKSNPEHRANSQLEARAKELFNSEYVSEETNTYNQQSWMKSVTNLGDKWLFHKNNFVTKKQGEIK